MAEGDEGGTRRRVPLTGPYDLGASLILGDYGRRNPILRWVSPTELHRATHTPEGPASVRVIVEPSAGRIEAEAWGPGREWVLDELPIHLGLDDEAPELPGKAGELQRRAPGLRRGRCLDLFELVVSYIIRQRVAWRDAVTTQSAIHRARGQVAPGPLDLRLPLDGDEWGAMTTADLAGFGLERKRAKTLLSLAARANRVRSWARLPAPEFARRLESFTGIGGWTRAMVQGHGLAEHDVVPLGDDGLPSSVSWFFAGEARADDARMLELLAPYAGQRFRVIHLLWVAGEGAPRFGPRIRGAKPS